MIISFLQVVELYWDLILQADHTNKNFTY